MTFLRKTICIGLVVMSTYAEALTKQQAEKVLSKTREAGSLTTAQRDEIINRLVTSGPPNLRGDGQGRAEHMVRDYVQKQRAAEREWGAARRTIQHHVAAANINLGAIRGRITNIQGLINPTDIEAERARPESLNGLITHVNTRLRDARAEFERVRRITGESENADYRATEDLLAELASALESAQEQEGIADAHLVLASETYPTVTSMEALLAGATEDKTQVDSKVTEALEEEAAPDDIRQKLREAQTKSEDLALKLTRANAYKNDILRAKNEEGKPVDKFIERARKIMGEILESKKQAEENIREGEAHLATIEDRITRSGRVKPFADLPREWQGPSNYQRENPVLIGEKNYMYLLRIENPDTGENQASATVHSRVKKDKLPKKRGKHTTYVGGLEGSIRVESTNLLARHLVAGDFLLVTVVPKNTKFIVKDDNWIQLDR